MLRLTIDERSVDPESTLDGTLEDAWLRRRLEHLNSLDANIERLAIPEPTEAWERSPLRRGLHGWAVAFTYVVTLRWLRDLFAWLVEKKRDLDELGSKGWSTTRAAVHMERDLDELERSFGYRMRFLTFRWILGGFQAVESQPVVSKELAIIIIGGVIGLLLLIESPTREETVIKVEPRDVVQLVAPDFHFKLPPAKKKASGGGGGGRHETLQASRGNRMPWLSPHPNPVAPPPTVVKVENPKLPIEPELRSVRKFVPPPDNVKKVYGIKNSPQILLPSNGTGELAGIGTGSSGGIGSGTGLGLGPGTNGGFGGGDFGPGGGGRGGMGAEVITPPRVLHQESAETTGQPDDVVAIIAIDAVGTVDLRRGIQIERGDRALAENIKQVLPRWRFSPKRINGMAVPCTMRIIVHFRAIRASA